MEADASSRSLRSSAYEERRHTYDPELATNLVASLTTLLSTNIAICNDDNDDGDGDKSQDNGNPPRTKSALQKRAGEVYQYLKALAAYQQRDPADSLPPVSTPLQSSLLATRATSTIATTPTPRQTSTATSTATTSTSMTSQDDIALLPSHAPNSDATFDKHVAELQSLSVIGNLTAESALHFDEDELYQEENYGLPQCAFDMLASAIDDDSQYDGRRTGRADKCASASSRSAEMCAICFEPRGPADGAVRLPCSHEFHRDCARAALEFNVSCPMCRAVAFTTESAKQMVVQALQVLMCKPIVEAACCSYVNALDPRDTPFANDESAHDLDDYDDWEANGDEYDYSTDQDDDNDDGDGDVDTDANTDDDDDNDDDDDDDDDAGYEYEENENEVGDVDGGSASDGDDNGDSSDYNDGDCEEDDRDEEKNGYGCKGDDNCQYSNKKEKGKERQHQQERQERHQRHQHQHHHQRNGGRNKSNECLSGDSGDGSVGRYGNGGDANSNSRSSSNNKGLIEIATSGNNSSGSSSNSSNSIGSPHKKCSANGGAKDTNMDIDITENADSNQRSKINRDDFATSTQDRCDSERSLKRKITASGKHGVANSLSESALTSKRQRRTISSDRSNTHDQLEGLTHAADRRHNDYRSHYQQQQQRYLDYHRHRHHHHRQATQYCTCCSDKDKDKNESVNENTSIDNENNNASEIVPTESSSLPPTSPSSSLLQSPSLPSRASSRSSVTFYHNDRGIEFRSCKTGLDL